MNTDVSTRLDAVNYALSSIGLASVPDLDMFNADVSMASMYLDNFSRSIQNHNGYGWWFNRESNHKMSPDAVNGVVTLPNNVLAAYTFDRFRRATKMVTRGRALYDTKQHHFDMRGLTEEDGYMHLTLVVQLDFDDLPQTAKDAVTKAAAFKFASSAEMEVNRLRILQDEMDEAYFQLQAEDTTQSANNAFTDSSELARFDMRVGGPNGIVW